MILQNLKKKRWSLSKPVKLRCNIMWNAVSWRLCRRGADWTHLQHLRRKGRKPLIAEDGSKAQLELELFRAKRSNTRMTPPDHAWRFYRRKYCFFLSYRISVKAICKDSTYRMINDENLSVYKLRAINNQSFGFVEGAMVLKTTAKCCIWGSEHTCHKWKLKCGFS